MNMPILNKSKTIVFLCAILIGCTKEKSTQYKIVDQTANDININKSKPKTEGKYISILYANLFQNALPINKLVATINVIQSVGDRAIVYEVILSNYMNTSGTKMPTNVEMRADLDKFIIETYLRFYLRYPSELEKSYFRNYISSDPNIKPELVYISFAASDEYLFY